MSDIEKFGIEVDGSDELYNIFQELRAIIESIAPVMPFALGDKRLREGKPGQFVVKLEEDLKLIEPDKQKRLVLLRDFVYQEKADFERLGREGYLDNRGVVRMSAIDEYFESGKLPVRQTLAGMLESNLTELAKRKQGEFKVRVLVDSFEQSLKRDKETVEKEVSLWRKGLSTLQESIKKLQNKIGLNVDILEQAKLRLQHEESRRQALAIKLAPLLKKASKNIGSKSAKTKHSNLIDSERGQDIMSDFIHTSTMISMATRRAMGMRITGTPTKSDFGIAKKMLERFIESGSISKRNINLHLRQVRVEAEQWTLKNSKSKNLKSKAPGFSKVREVMADMGMSFDELERNINNKKNTKIIDSYVEKSAETSYSKLQRLQRNISRAINERVPSDDKPRGSSDNKLRRGIERERERNRKSKETTADINKDTDGEPKP